MKLFEMEGFLRGKCLPGDMKVNETNAEYLVRKFTDLEQKLADSQREFRAADATIENLQMQFEKVAAENAGLKDALECVINPDNQPEYHDQGMGCGVEDRGYQRDGYSACYYGWESAMERVYSEVIPDAIPETQETDAFLAEVRAQVKADGVQEYADSFRHSASKIRECHGDTIRVRALLHEANNADEFAAQLRRGVQS